MAERAKFACGQLPGKPKVAWPSGNHDDMVLDGILDALVGWEYKLPVARFSLVDIGWHPVHSAPSTWYLVHSQVALMLSIPGFWPIGLSFHSHQHEQT